jgi:Ni/Co efflux regulator RcnB
MKSMLLALLTVSVLAAPIARAAQEEADQAEHSAHHPQAAEGTGAKSHDPAQHLSENMKTMQDVMARLRQATDPEEKKRLLRVHMLAMQEQIRTMRAAGAGEHDHSGGGDAKEHKDGGAPEGKGGDAKKGGMMGGGMMGGGMMKMHKKMEQRVEALEQLLEQLIEHEAAEDELPGR